MTEGRREPPSVSTAPRRAAPDPRERVGPLLVERHRKGDGRSLILYREATGSG